MNDQMNQPVRQPTTSSGNERIMAIASLVIGIVNLCAWFLPICGFPLGLIGVALGYMGMKDESQKTIAMIGMILSTLGILLACINAMAGVMLNTGDIYRQILQGLG